MKTVIMAGGKGSRVAEINSKVPKPMIQIAGKPVLEYALNCLKKQEFTDIILVIGYLGDVIETYFEDGSKWGVSIEYIKETEPLGTAGALYLLKDIITDDFLLVNGDIIFDIDLLKFYQKHKEYGGTATLFTHPNAHPYDSGIVIMDEEGCVTDWLHKEEDRKWYRNRVNAGIHFLSKDIFTYLKELKKTDLDRDILKPLIAEKKLYAYVSPEYVKDMGTPDRLMSITKDVEQGKLYHRNLSKKQKAIFLDRDGTINKYKGFLRNIDDMELMKGVPEAVRIINESEYLAIVVTNQPVVARGEVTFGELKNIHCKLETLLGRQGAYLDDIFYCPHHPDRGYAGEITELKIECNCRKPKPGMLLEAAKKYNIDLEQSIMIGDDEKDIQAGQAAGCTCYTIDNENKIITNKADVYATLLKCIRDLIPNI